MRRVRFVAVGGLALLATAPFVAAPASSSVHWTPARGLRWQVQLQGAVNTGICAKPFPGGACVHPDVFDVDLYAGDGVTLNTAAVAKIHAKGRHAVCYVDAGTWENWRPDASKYPKSVLGKGNGWPGERWLDVRRSGLLAIIDARVQRCAKAHFDAVDFDNVDGYSNATGFAISASAQLTFNRALAKLAHSHGLAVGLKNDLGQASALRSSFDFAVNEQCFLYHECGGYDAWTHAGKPVVEIEYSGVGKQYCADAAAHGRDAITKQLDLKATPWQTCR